MNRETQYHSIRHTTFRENRLQRIFYYVRSQNCQSSAQTQAHPSKIVRKQKHLHYDLLEE